VKNEYYNSGMMKNMEEAQGSEIFSVLEKVEME
jgi:hypothetical protein